MKNTSVSHSIEVERLTNTHGRPSIAFDALPVPFCRRSVATGNVKDVGDSQSIAVETLTSALWPHPIAPEKLSIQADVLSVALDPVSTEVYTRTDASGLHPIAVLTPSDAVFLRWVATDKRSNAACPHPTRLVALSDSSGGRSLATDDRTCTSDSLSVVAETFRSASLAPPIALATPANAFIPSSIEAARP